MLVLSRRKGEKIVIDQNVTITVVDIGRDKVRLGLVAPKDVPVHRQDTSDAEKIFVTSSGTRKASKATNTQATKSNAEYVTQTADGSWRVSGTRVSLDSIVHAYSSGRIPEAIVADFPSLTLEQVYGAVAFYLRHRSMIDKYLAEQDTRWQEAQQESAARHGPLLQRIRQSAAFGKEKL